MISVYVFRYLGIKKCDSSPFKLFIFSVLVLFSISIKAQGIKINKAINKRSYYLPGDYIQDFKLKNTDGRFVSLHDYQHQKGLVIVFMRNTCEYCQAYESRIKQLSRKYAPLGFPLLAISPFGDDSKNSPLDDLAHMKILAHKEGFDFPFLSDEKFRMTTLFNDQYTPSAYVLQNVNGRMKLIYGGDIDNDWENINPKRKRFVERSLDSILSVEKKNIKILK